MAAITGSVGDNGANNHADVLTVQQLLNVHVGALGLERLEEEGLIGIRTIGAIRKYQAHVLGMAAPDGRIDVGGPTWRSLAAATGTAPAPARAAPRASGKAKWVWDQSSGTLAWEGRVFAKGYAGRGAGKNNPDMQDIVKTGPIPRGLWRMTKSKNSPLGRCTIELEAEPGTDRRGRSLFRVHGDKIGAPGTASEGCIILGYEVRKAMWARRDESPLIEVVE